MFRKFTSQEMNEVNSLVEGISNPQFETEDEEEWTAEFMRICQLPMTESTRSSFMGSLTESQQSDMEKALSPIHSKQKSARDSMKHAKGDDKQKFRRELSKLAIAARKVREKYLGKSKGKVGAF